MSEYQYTEDLEWDEEEAELDECNHCFALKELTSFPLCENYEGETIWSNGCDDCIAAINPEYAAQLGIKIDAESN